MNGPIGKSVSTIEKYQKLRRAAGAGDTLAILVNADPDALASALALKRLFWRKVKPVTIFRINRIDRADNLAFIKLLDIRHSHIRSLKNPRSQSGPWWIPNPPTTRSSPPSTSTSSSTIILRPET